MGFLAEKSLGSLTRDHLYKRVGIPKSTIVQRFIYTQEIHGDFPLSGMLQISDRVLEHSILDGFDLLIEEEIL